MGRGGGKSGRRDAAEFLGLLEPIKEGLARYIHRCAWSAADVQDIAQHAVAVGWREFHRYQAGTNFRAWMFKIAVNAIYKFNKRFRRERATSDVEQLEIEDAVEREEHWQSVLAEPERIVEALDERLVKALDTLPTEARHCLMLRLLEGFSYREIADMLDIPIGTVMSHVHRARMKLREQLTELAAEHGLLKASHDELS
jgi:RNA polymerase sigma-70 factor (ECF subfamily)